MNPIYPIMAKVIPLVYDDSLSYYEFVNKVVQKVNELIRQYNWIKEWIDNVNKDIAGFVCDTLNKWKEDGTLKSLLEECCITFWVNPEWFGAKLDGETDDSKAVQEAIEYGNVKFPHNCKCYLGQIVNVTNSGRIVDGNMGTFTGLNDYPMFKINDFGKSNIQRVAFKNMFVDLHLSGSFLQCANSYFVQFDNIRVINVHSSQYAIKIVNGFNIDIHNVFIYGSSSNDDTVSGNHAKGIIFDFDDTTPETGLWNITNCNIDNVLIQRVEYGLWLNKTSTNGAADTFTMRNVGFSSCGTAIKTKSIYYDISINTLRCEYSGIAIDNESNVSINNCFIYRTDFIKNTGEITLNGPIELRPDTDGNDFIVSNKGRINAENACYNIFSGYNFGTNDGEYIGVPRVSTKNNVPPSQFSPFYSSVYPYISYLDFDSYDVAPKGTYKIKNVNDAIIDVKIGGRYFNHPMEHRNISRRNLHTHMETAR